MRSAHAASMRRWRISLPIYRTTPLRLARCGIIYHAAGWDNYGHYVDAADYGVADTEKLLPHILAELKAQPSFVVDDILGVYLGQNGYTPDMLGYQLQTTFTSAGGTNPITYTTTKSNKKRRAKPMAWKNEAEAREQIKRWSPSIITTSRRKRPLSGGGSHHLRSPRL